MYHPPPPPSLGGSREVKNTPIFGTYPSIWRFGPPEWLKRPGGGYPAKRGGGYFGFLEGTQKGAKIGVFGFFGFFGFLQIWRVLVLSFGGVESAVGGCRRVLFPQFRVGRATVGGYQRVNSGWARRGFGIGLSQEVGVLLLSVGKVLQ